MKNQHVLQNYNGKWAVVSDGSRKATKQFKEKQDAVKFARIIARNQESSLIIHAIDGSVQTNKSYKK